MKQVDKINGRGLNAEYDGLRGVDGGAARFSTDMDLFTDRLLAGAFCFGDGGARSDRCWDQSGPISACELPKGLVGLVEGGFGGSFTQETDP